MSPEPCVKGVIAFLLAFHLHAQIVPPSILQTVEPQYDPAVKDYAVDPAVLTVLLDNHGKPLALQSSSGLPNSVVHAISQWKFSPATEKGKPIGVTTDLTINIQRPMSYFQTIAARRSLADYGEWQLAITEGLKLSPSAAIAMEKKLKDKIESAAARISLAAYASATEGKEARELQTRQIDWFVRNQPGSGVLGAPQAMLFTAAGSFQNIEGYSHVRALWLERLSHNSDDADVLGHATYFFRLSDPEIAEKLLLAALPRIGGAASWLGELYGLASIGTTGLDYRSGEPSTTGSRLPDAGFGKRARLQLASTNDTRVILSALNIVTMGGRSLAGSGGLPEGYGDFCRELLAHAKVLYPAEDESCDGPPIRAGSKVEQARLIKKAIPSYPPEARSGGIQGSVRFSAIIGKDGKIGSLELLKAPLIFYESAQSAVSKWEYEPTRLNGEPIEVMTQIDVNYTLQ